MKDLDAYNVYPTYRVGQREAIQGMLDTYEKIKTKEITSKVIELASPTGSGKTVINRAAGMALLDTHPEIKKITYTTPLRNLVQQIRDDIKLKLPVVMGRSNYPCEVFEGLDASDCPYRSAILIRKRPIQCRKCQYMQAKNAFKISKFGVCTLDFFMYNRLDTDVIIVDESSGLEDKLLNHFAISLPKHIDLDNLVNSIHNWMISLQDEEMILEESLESINFESTRSSLQRDIQNITRKLNQTTRLVAKCGRILKMAKDPNDYFIDRERNFKLLHGAYPFNLMASKVQLVIMSSGTPTTSLLTRNFTRVEAPHPIPIGMRKVYYTPVGKMSRDNQDKTIPLMAARIMEIHRACPKNTLVHTHSFGLIDKFRPYMKHSAVMFQEQGQREESLNKFLSSKESIWFSAAYAQGLSLMGSQFQRNIIAKVPYPGLGEWVVKRNESDIAKIGMDMWYRMSTAVDIQQAAGRCTRSPTDYSETYILDSNFGYFFNQNKQFFEQWFKDALIWEKKEKKPVKSRCKT